MGLTVFLLLTTLFITLTCGVSATVLLTKNTGHLVYDILWRIETTIHDMFLADAQQQTSILSLAKNIGNVTNSSLPLPSGGSSGGSGGSGHQHKGSGTITVGPIATKHAMLQCVHGNITSLAQEISINASQVSNETKLNQFGNSTLRCMATPHYMSIPGPMSTVIGVK